jgi:hypothetical protein
VKQIPTPQLIRIPDLALASIDSLTPEAINPPNHSQETLWEELPTAPTKAPHPPRVRQVDRLLLPVNGSRKIANHFPPRIPGQHQTTSNSSGVGVAAAPTQRGQSLSYNQSTHLSTEISGGVRWQTKCLQFLPKRYGVYTS